MSLDPCERIEEFISYCITYSLKTELRMANSFIDMFVTGWIWCPFLPCAPAPCGKLTPCPSISSNWSTIVQSSSSPTASATSRDQRRNMGRTRWAKLVSSRFFDLTKLVFYTIPSRKQDLWRCTCNSLSVCNLLFHLLNFISSLAMTCTKFFNVDLEFNAMDNAMFYIWYYQNVKKIYIDEMIWEDNLE